MLIDIVNEYFDYSEKHKTLIWKKAPYKSRVKVGDIAGKISSPNGRTEHYRIGIKGKVYTGHRLAWAFHHGENPPNMIDHLNGNGLDNSKANMVETTYASNNKNKRLATCNKTGVQGVNYRGRDESYEVTIGVSGKTKYLGRRKDFFEACCLRKSAERKHYYSFNHGL